jgi:hypothetical protein
LQKTLDLIGQLRGAAVRGPLGANLVPLLDQADGLLRRGVVQASYTWAVRGMPDVAEGEVIDEDWDIQLLPEHEPRGGVGVVGDRRPRRRDPAPLKRRTPVGGGARSRGGPPRRRR